MRIGGIQQCSMIDYPGKVSCIVFLSGCNFRCGFCHNPELVLPQKIREMKNTFIHPDAFFEFLSQRRGLLDGVVISGGEPTIMPDLELFIEKIKERGFLVKLDTNGSNPEIVKKLVAKKYVDYVAMDVKADEEGYSSFMGPGVSFDRVFQSIDFLKKSGVVYEFRSTLIREFHTNARMKGMARLMQGASTLYLQRFRSGITLDSSYECKTAFSDEEMNSIALLFRKNITNVFIR